LRTPFAALTRTVEGRATRFDFPVLTASDALAPVAWMLLCTKTYETPAARPWLARLAPEGTLAVLQNGIDHIERVSAFLPPERILPVVVHAACEREAPGEVCR